MLGEGVPCDSWGLEELWKVMGAGLTVCLPQGSGEGFCLDLCEVQRKGSS